MIIIGYRYSDCNDKNGPFISSIVKNGPSVTFFGKNLLNGQSWTIIHTTIMDNSGKNLLDAM